MEIWQVQGPGRSSGGLLLLLLLLLDGASTWRGALRATRLLCTAWLPSARRQ